MSSDQENLLIRISKNIAHLLDLQVEQRSLTAQKIVQASDILSDELRGATLLDLKALLLLESDLKVSARDANSLVVLDTPRTTNYRSMLGQVFKNLALIIPRTSIKRGCFLRC